MVDAVFRGNIEQLLSVISHLKKYIIAFVIVLLVLLSIFHFSKYSVQFVPLFTITLVLLPAVYYTTVLVLKFCTCIVSPNQTSEVAAMNANGDQGHGLKTPERPYPNCPTPPPTYEEATRNDHYYQPQPWLPSTSSGYTRDNGSSAVFNVHQYYRNGGNTAPAVANHAGRPDDMASGTADQNNATGVVAASGGGVIRPVVLKPIHNIPSVTITLDDDDDQRSSMEI